MEWVLVTFERDTVKSIDGWKYSDRRTSSFLNDETTLFSYDGTEKSNQLCTWTVHIVADYLQHIQLDLSMNDERERESRSNLCLFLLLLLLLAIV